MKKIYLLLLSAAMSLTAFASGELVICGDTITKEVIDAGIVDSLSKNPKVSALSGTITYDTVNYVLTLTDVNLVSSATSIIAITDSANVTGKVVTIKVVGSNTLRITSSYYPKIIETTIQYSKSDLRIVGADRNSSLVLEGPAVYYALFIPTIVTIKDLQVHVKNGLVGVNGTAGQLTIDNSTLEIDDTRSAAFDGLSKLTLTKCALVAPEGAQLLSSGVWRPSGNTDPIIIVREPIAGDTIEVAGVKYEVHNMNPGSEQVYVVKQDYAGSSLVIPASIEYVGITFQVYMINQDAFRSNTNITSVDIACPTIWSNAFDNCANLETITLREGVRDIRFGAFNSLPKAKTVEIPATVNHIAGDGRSWYDAISPFGRNSFETITIAEGNQWYKIGEDGALYTMNGEKLIAFPNASPDKRVGVIPEGVKEIVNEAFYQTPMADTVVLPTTLEKCPRILASEGAKCVIINSPCNSDFNQSFYYLNGLQEVVLGPKCKYLGSKMFYNSGNISKITILSDTIPEWRYEAGNSDSPFSTSTFTKAKVYVRCGMGDTFRANTNKWASFTNNIIDTLLYDVKVEADKGTAWISQIVDCNTRRVSISGIPYGYTFVKWNNGETTTTATYTITSDTVIRAIVKKDLSISETFQSETVEGVPVTYKILSKNKERGEFTVQVGMGSWNSPAILKTYDGVLTIPDSAVYYDEKYAVVTVSQCAFYRCNVADVILPEGLTEIGQDAFAYSHITTMVVPNSVTKMLSEAFYGCDSLVSVTLSNNLTEIPMRGFSYCSITEINIPASVEYLYSTAFSYCPNLATVTWHPENLKQIGSHPFQNTPWFEAYPAEENGAKYAGDKLLDGSNDDITSLTIKEGTKMIATSALELFRNLTDIYVPSSVESIGWGAFYDAKLERCTLDIVTPPTFFNGGMRVFDNDVKAKELFDQTYYYKVLVYVPKEAVNTYKEHAKWTEMADNIRPIGGWTVTFRDHNGNNLIAPQQVEQGEKAVAPESVDTWYTNDYMYEFANAWDTAIVNVGDTIYSARYTQNDLPVYKVYFYETQEDAAAQTKDIGFSKVQHGHAIPDDVVAAEEALIDVRECEEIYEWAGGDITNVTSDLHVYPVWGDGFYNITFFDPIANEIIAVREDVECGEIVTAPDAPEHEGKKFDHWDDLTWKTTRRYTGDLTVNAVYVDNSEDIENISDSAKAVKVIRDGQLFIEKNGKTYNAQGEIVK